MSGRREASRRPGRAVVEGAAAAAVACIVAAIPVLTALKLREDGMALILAAAAAAGLLLQRIVALRNRREARVARDALLDDALAWWPAPLVQEADPYELGAFPPGTGDYSSRDVDAQLDAALQKPGYVLVIGPVGSGKSRAAFAALQRRLGEARLHVPEDAESLGQLIAAGPPLAAGPQGAVLWLDCVDRFLGGLRLDAVDRWIREGDIRSVVATIADEQVGELLQAPGPQGHVARRLLARARAIRVDAALTPAELVATRKQFPDRSFEHGVGHAFRPGWQPGPEPAFTAPMPDAKRRRRRLPDLGVALAVLAMLAITATVSGLALRYDGLKQPAALATQITQLKSDLRGCAKVVGSENAVHEGIPVVAIIEPDPKCAARRPESQSVVLYDDRYDVLEQVGGFAPPRSGPLMHSGFGCLGQSASSCWTDLVGNDSLAIVGVFQSTEAQLVLPVVVRRPDQAPPQIAPLLRGPPDLASRFEAAVYRRPVALGGRDGHMASGAVVLPPVQRDGTALPARLVAAYAPREVAPNRFEYRAYLLRHGTHTEAVDSCHVVRDGVEEMHPVLRLRSGVRLSRALRARWLRLERAREGICVHVSG